MPLPAFIAFTGVDRRELLEGMVRLSSRYPIEWGLLVDADRDGHEPLFPGAMLREAIHSAGRLRWAAHVCGSLARAIADGPEAPPLSLAGFQRVQVNHGFAGSTPAQVARCAAFGRTQGVRAVLQCQGAFPADGRVDWLYDTSFGRGARPSDWPPLAPEGAFCGFSGGIGPDNVREVLARIGAPSGIPYWIDMESAVRTAGAFDLAKCEAVCRAVYGNAP
jgi:hypothetical protein